MRVVFCTRNVAEFSQPDGELNEGESWHPDESWRLVATTTDHVVFARVALDSSELAAHQESLIKHRVPSAAFFQGGGSGN